MLPARLIAISLDEEVANARRRKAKGNRDKRANPGKRSLELLGWQIMLTNCESEALPPSRAREIYAMRWRIETIFKAWKSGLEIDEFSQRGSAEMAEAIVQAALLRTTLIHAVGHPKAGGARSEPESQRSEADGPDRHVLELHLAGRQGQRERTGESLQALQIRQAKDKEHFREVGLTRFTDGGLKLTCMRKCGSEYHPWRRSKKVELDLRASLS